MKTWRRFFSSLGKLVGVKESSEQSEIDFRKLEDVLRYSIKNKNLFREALSHRSYLQVSGDKYNVTNERLEFLGDSVLNLVIGEFLFRNLPDAEEGELTKLRARLVNRKALSIIANDLHLSDFLLMSPNAQQLSERGRETVLSDAFEAIIGAIYLDSSFQEAKKFIEQQMLSAIERKLIKLKDENYKSQLLEQSQSVGLGIPRYVTIDETGPDHDRTFTVEVFLGKNSYGIGIGKNKKDAEQAAAEQALKNLIVKENQS